MCSQTLCANSKQDVGSTGASSVKGQPIASLNHLASFVLKHEVVAAHIAMQIARSMDGRQSLQAQHRACLPSGK